MEISSHYYALLALCRAKGISKEVSQRIAYASQFVDDAKINYLFVDEDKSDDPLFMKNKDGSVCIKHIATCHSYFKIKTYNYSSMIYNTCAFHFIPGCEGEYFVDKLICREDSHIINEIMQNNLGASAEKFGMLLHIYADTFAHQGFSGLLSKKNIIENLDYENGTFGVKFDNFKRKTFNFFVNFFSKEKDLKFKNIIPAYGHGQAYHYPDLPYLKYSYNYNNETHENAQKKKIEVDNRQRYKKAFESISKYLDRYIQTNSLHIDETDNDKLIKFYKILSQKASDKKKIKLWRKYLIKNGYFDSDSFELKYDENLWLKDCFDDFNKDKYQVRIINGAKLKQGYKDKSWYKFVSAVKEYKIEFVDILKINGIDIPK